MRVICFFFSVIIFKANVGAQVSYSFNTATGIYSNILGTSPTLTAPGSGYPSTDEGVANGIPIGFTFNYNGTNYTSVGISSNGFICFGNLSTTATTYANDLTSGFFGARPIIAALWGDLDIQDASNLTYSTTGSGADMIFTVEWKLVKWNYEAAAPSISFQVKLFKTSNVIEFIYRQEAGSLNAAYASIGITGLNSGSGNFMSLLNTTPSATVSTSNENNSISTRPATGQIFRFTPLACGPLTDPQLFGQSQTFVFCKNESIGFGVFNSVVTQDYYFSLFQRGGLDTIKKSGPLDGNGGQLSVAISMLSAADAGEYRVTTVDGCGNKATTKFYAFYGNIDNLRILTWGTNAVSFGWAACNAGTGTCNYEYAVTTIADPNSLSVVYNTTSDTSASVSGLTNGVTYYIHVRLKEAFINGNQVDLSFNCNDYGTQTLRFVSCSSSSVPVGSASPINAILCEGGTTQLTASGGNSYQWYNENNTAINGATSGTFTASAPGQYRVYITTGTACQGMVRSITVTQARLEPATFSGGGSYEIGDTVKMGISNTLVGQTYKILRDGTEVYSIDGIGRAAFESEDTLWYKFKIDLPFMAGNYSVRTNNAYCNPLDFGSLPVSVNNTLSICPGSSTTFNVLSPGAGYNFQWQVNTGTGFNNISNSSVYSGVTTRTLTVINPPQTFYGYQYRCIETGATTIISGEKTLKFSARWNGSSNNAWNNAANWSCGAVPGPNMDVVIPIGMPRYPIVSSNTSCRSIDVKNGATVTVSPGVSLTLTGK